jgi:ABC-type branched-subunit amino acid transport system ATPase component
MMPAERGGERPLLRVEGVSVHHGGAPVLDDVTFDVAGGEAVAVLGQRGSGKTALLDLISGFLRPDRGRVTLCGQDISRWPPHRIARAGLARGFQNAPMLEADAAYDAICAAAAGRRLGRRETREAVEQALTLSDLHSVCSRGAFPGVLEQRLLRLACVAAAAPSLALLDEPLAGLAPPAAGRIVSVLRMLHDLGIALVVTGHDPAALRVICSRAVLLRDGRLTGGGRPLEMHRA